MNFNVERGLSTEECNNAGLTDGQRIALELMSMLKNTFILKGYAGTGKTYLLAYFLRVCRCKRILITAPTHKAVGVANGTSTIHSYLCLKMKYNEDKQIFEKAPFCENIRHGDLVIVDEASMISTELLAFLLEAQEFYDLKLIFIGDPCFAKGTEILMFDGSIKKIEDVVIGDIVMGPDSCQRTVLKTCNGISNMYKIDQRNGESYVVTQNHKIAFKRRNIYKLERYKKYGNTALVEAKDAINFSDKFNEIFGGYNAGPISFMEKDISIDPYYLGYWLGDGDSSWTRVSTSDKEVVYFCKEYAKSIGLKCRVKYDDKKHYYRCAITSSIGFHCGKGINALLMNLKNYNLLNNKHIPRDYLINSIEKRMSLLAGLIDSDGNYDKNGNRYSFSNKNKELIDNVYLLATQLGFRCSKINNVNSVNIYQTTTIYIMGNNIDKIPCRIERKIATKPKKNKNVTSIKISEYGVGEYFGIEVDCDNLLLLKDGTVVSNCQIPPVGEKVSPVWDLKCDSFTLTEIVRQARDSNIISLATAVREGTAYTHGVNRFVNDKDVFSGDFKKMKLFYEKCIEKDVFPQIISHKNVIVDSSNKWARGMVKGHDVDDFMVGEEVYIRSVNEEQVHKLEDIVKIAAISNPYKFKIYVDNPIMVLDILIRSEKGEETLTIPFSDEDARKFVKNKEILAERARAKKAEWRTFWWYSNAISEIKHIYAMTAHRAQGSTFRNVIINCKDIPDRNLMYTAVTRASKRVFLFR